MSVKTITLVKDFTEAPGGRNRSLGDYSGEQFREDLLRPALAQHDQVIVDLNGALGLPSSFLDEAFGEFSKEMTAGKLVIKLSDNSAAKAILDACTRSSKR